MKETRSYDQAKRVALSKTLVDDIAILVDFHKSDRVMHAQLSVYNAQPYRDRHVAQLFP